MWMLWRLGRGIGSFMDEKSAVNRTCHTDSDEFSTSETQLKQWVVDCQFRRCSHIQLFMRHFNALFFRYRMQDSACHHA